MSDAEVIKRLDAIIAILKLTNSEALEQVRARAESDVVTVGILEATEDGFVSSGELKKRVAAQTKQSERTVVRRISELLAMGLLEKRPTGTAAYRNTGII